LAAAINFGIYNVSNEWALVINEDNVFAKDWDKILNLHIKHNFQKENQVISINQIEPLGPSIYNIHIKNFGTTLEDFRLEDFWDEERMFRSGGCTDDGSTFPFLIRKKDFLKVGGFDVEYPSPFVVDWDFFLKCELAVLDMIRIQRFNFYHFVSKSTKNRNGYIETPNEKQEFFKGENEAAEYFEYKWGFPPHRDKNNRCKQFIPF
jgi:hypothetical protein